ncbi:uroporphyrinogen-III synthase [Alteromonas gilva]|uniref:Uroporphyrinogen-III synthase n=1 Tax=Alteromonas gilva TaxID=2987522 RepID=A0ABT5L4L0_9ALTE|nr:uroporphyrinogen-III synthase [Alteromonas gilva]MDC8831975.1 uroporphyrinogen-III synthase [Alteromonas gilva]
MYLITRPLPKLAATSDAFANHGLCASVVALQDIQVIDHAILTLTQWLTANPHSTLIVTSTAAAQPLLTHCLPLLSRCQLITVGQSTAHLFAQAGLSTVVPEQENSEGVLALPSLKDCADQRILLLKGKGGRHAINHELQNRGARLSVIDLYQRVPLNAPVFSQAPRWSEIHGIIATSGEQAQALINEFNTQPLATYRWLTVSERIAQQLHEQGIRHVYICPKASNEALIEWIQQNWE